MKDFIKKFTTTFFALIIAFVVLVWWAFAVSTLNLNFQSWSQLQASDLQSMVNKINELTNEVNSASVPAWAIMAFNKYDCPVGWRASDGWAWTINLRWVFLRWMEDFWTWEHNRDPNRGWRWTLWSYQWDELKSHTHNIQTYAWNVSWDWNYIDSTDDGWLSWYNNSAWLSTWWSETRPKNVAVLYCQKM